MKSVRSEKGENKSVKSRNESQITGRVKWGGAAK